MIFLTVTANSQKKCGNGHGGSIGFGKVTPITQVYISRKSRNRTSLFCTDRERVESVRVSGPRKDCLVLDWFSFALRQPSVLNRLHAPSWQDSLLGDGRESRTPILKCHLIHDTTCRASSDGEDKNHSHRGMSFILNCKTICPPTSTKTPSNTHTSSAN